MFDDFEEFRSNKRKESETFLYWDTFIHMVRLAKDLVRADREGDWTLHIQSVEAALPYFAAFDSNNYLRWCTVYIEDMKMLPKTSPEVFNSFMEGKFVVKQSSVPFSAVATDMCLEQTINRSSKSTGGIIGNTRRKEFVARWNVIHHEMMSISETFRELSGVQLANTELSINHSFSTKHTKETSQKVEQMIRYILKYENPFIISQSTELKLHNFLTKTIMPDEVRTAMSSLKETSESLYWTFRKERLVDKTKRLCDPIPRNNLKTFGNCEVKKKVQPKKQMNQDKKEIGAAQKKLDIARVRGYDPHDVFSYDLVKDCFLFDSCGLMKKPSKHELVKELEKNLEQGDYIPQAKWTDMPTGYIVDVMANVRKLPTSSISTFGQLCQKFSEMMTAMCKNAERIDFVFDCYVEGSVKDNERQRRMSKTPIVLSDITNDTRLPKDMDSFWPSADNKVKLEVLLRNWLKEHYTHQNDQGLKVFFSQIVGVNVSVTTEIISDGALSVHPSLDSNLEEADIRIIPHCLDSVRSGLKRLAILSNDTDVFVIAMYFVECFKSNGLIELWFRAGTGETTRYIPLHVLASKLGQPLCEVLPAVHALTGCDVTSKFGTKSAGLKVDPTIFLKDFGKIWDDATVCNAEHYLVQVLSRGNHSITTLDDLRYNMYHQRKATTILDLPPTSHAAKGHILRAFYAAYIQINCLTNVSLDPLQYGFQMEEGTLEAKSVYRPLPDHMATNCTCMKCATSRCPCRDEGLPCCAFCKCQSRDHNPCKNPNGLIHEK